MARQRAVTSPMGGRRAKPKLSGEQRTRIAVGEAARDRSAQAAASKASERTKRMGIRAGVGAEAARRGGDPAAAMKMVTGSAPGAATPSPRLTTRQKYLKTQLGIPVGTPGEGAARRKAYKAKQAGLKASEMEYERTRTQPYLQRLQKLYEPYKKSPEGDIYHKGEMTMPRRSKLTGIRGMQYLQKPPIAQQYAADQTAAGLPGGGRGMRAPAPAAAAPGREQQIQELDRLNAQLQATQDPAAAQALIQQFDQAVSRLEGGAPQAAPPGPPEAQPQVSRGQAGGAPQYSPGFQAFQVPGYQSREIPPLGYEPSRAIASDFQALPGMPTAQQVQAAPMTAPAPGQEELAAREGARPLYMRPSAAGATGAAGTSPFGGPTAQEQAATARSLAEVAGITEATRGGEAAREQVGREVATSKWAAIDTAALTRPNVSWGRDIVGRDDYEGAKRMYEDVKSRAQGSADAVAFLNLHGAAVRKAITVAQGAGGDAEIRQAYIGWLEKLLTDLDAIAAQATAPGPAGSLAGGRTPPAQQRHPGAW